MLIMTMLHLITVQLQNWPNLLLLSLSLVCFSLKRQMQPEPKPAFLRPAGLGFRLLNKKLSIGLGIINVQFHYLA